LISSGLCPPLELPGIALQKKKTACARSFEILI